MLLQHAVKALGLGRVAFNAILDLLRGIILVVLAQPICNTSNIWVILDIAAERAAAYW
jgi:hypothetical protein